jgi:hypothetical protein
MSEIVAKLLVVILEFIRLQTIHDFSLISFAGHMRSLFPEINKIAHWLSFAGMHADWVVSLFQGILGRFF